MPLLLAARGRRIGRVVPPAALPAPVAADDTAPGTTAGGTAIVLDVLANDTYSGTPTITITAAPALGTATVTGSGAASRVEYTPPASGSGAWSLTYSLSATGNAGSDTATVSGTVAAAGAGLVQTGLLADWRMDDGTGQQVTDYGSAARHAWLGTSTDPSEADEPTWAPEGLTFSGGQRVVGPSMAQPTTWHLDIVFEMSAASADYSMLFVASTTGDDNATPLQVFRNGNGSGLLYRIGTGAAQNDTAGTIAVADGGWHHLQVDWDGSTLLCHVDGAQDVSAAKAITANSLTSGVQMGMRGAQFALTGQLGGASWYSGALDAAGRDQNRTEWIARMSARGVTLPGGAAGDAEAPTTPTGLTATAVSSSRIDLAWNASTDNVGVTGYEVERTAPGPTVTVVDVGNALAYSHTGLSPSTAYSYRVRAYDAAGNRSGWSTSAGATTQAAAAGAQFSSAFSNAFKIS